MVLDSWNRGREPQGFEGEEKFMKGFPNSHALQHAWSNINPQEL
jgi:hypothetical protein